MSRPRHYTSFASSGDWKRRRYAPCAARTCRRYTRCCGSAARGCRTHSYTPRRRRGLLCELPRGIVGIFICDVIILLFCRPVKFVIGILHALPVAIGRQREGSFMDPLNKIFSKIFLSSKKSPCFLAKTGAMTSALIKIGKKQRSHHSKEQCDRIFIGCLPAPSASTFYWRCSLMAACAAARRAMGTRKGLQET